MEQLNGILTQLFTSSTVQNSAAGFFWFVWPAAKVIIGLSIAVTAVLFIMNILRDIFDYIIDNINFKSAGSTRGSFGSKSGGIFGDNQHTITNFFDAAGNKTMSNEQNKTNESMGQTLIRRFIERNDAKNKLISDRMDWYTAHQKQMKGKMNSLLLTPSEQTEVAAELKAINKERGSK